MNRCFSLLLSHRMWRIFLLPALCSLVLCAAMPPAFAQTDMQPAPRAMPTQAQRASMVVTQAPELLLNGVPDRLSPGARIHDANNMLALPASLTGQKYLVNYVREMNALVHEVWILTPLEASLPPAN